MNNGVAPSTLYIVSTPIGNLEDISVRALHVLSSVDLIAAEDTRTTRVLLNHYHVIRPLVSFHSYNEARRTPELIAKLRTGSSIALVSDAGTPGISDPAFRIIRAALDGNIPVSGIPGPTAFLPALIVSGLPIDRFVFEGFLPIKKGRKTALGLLAAVPHTIVLYESPHRLLRTLRDLREAFGDRTICVARELTKKFEEHFRGSINDSLAHFSRKKILGEFVLVVAGTGEVPVGDPDGPD